MVMMDVITSEREQAICILTFKLSTINITSIQKENKSIQPPTSCI